MVKLRRLTAVTLSSALVAAGALLASPAAHAVSPAFHEVGLYGTSDPTYDGVYRQSLAILGLEAAGRTPAPEAVQWLLNQQCADGGFSSYKSTVACPAFDSVAFTGGRDSNATAMAVSALEWIGTPASIAAATKAATYLRGVNRVLVMPHTDCRMASATESQIHESIERDFGVDTRSVEFRTVDNQETALSTDLVRIRSHPLLPTGLVVGGAIYDVHTGKLIPKAA